MNRAIGYSARLTRAAAIVAIAILTAGCTAFGGAGMASLDGQRLETSSAGASVGTGGVTTRTSHSVSELRRME